MLSIVLFEDYFMRTCLTNDAMKLGDLRTWVNHDDCAPQRVPCLKRQARALLQVLQFGFRLGVTKISCAFINEFMTGRISVVEGDITRQSVGAIVNAANTSLLGGGGVDGAIHRAAGPELLEECRKLDGCPTGSAKITKGYRLSARWVIHTVGPVWRDGQHGEDELLAQCYRSCLALAAKHDIRSLAFPSISTGAYRFPLERAANIAVREVRISLEQNQLLETVIFVCFGNAAYECYLKAVASPVK